MLALFAIQFLFPTEVTVKIDVPSSVRQGEEFTVRLIINKGQISGVGHMKQELPAGLENITVVEAKDSEFKYLPEDNVVKFTWISLPAEEEFTVSYKAVVKSDLPDGKINLSGKFSYVINNEKQTFVLPETVINISKEILAAGVRITDTTRPLQPEITITKLDTTAIAASQPSTSTIAETKPSTNVKAIRTIVGSPEAGSEFTVEINVNKNNVKGFARIQEILPAGLTAMPLESKGGTFSFIDQKVKIIWDNLPADENIKIAYRVSVVEDVLGTMSITGAFSYVENDDPKKVEIDVTTISILPKSSLAANTAVDASTTKVKTIPETIAETTSVATTPVQTTTTQSADNILYKVQICALSKLQRGTSYFESKFALGNKVSMEFHDGWRKYIVGKYHVYNEARDYRESVRLKGIESPFVTAYNSGKRITVQEALMVSNQQWVR